MALTPGQKVNSGNEVPASYYKCCNCDYTVRTKTTGKLGRCPECNSGEYKFIGE